MHTSSTTEKTLGAPDKLRQTCSAAWRRPKGVPHCGASQNFDDDRTNAHCTGGDLLGGGVQRVPAARRSLRRPSARPWS